jgi:hypothetical protein
MDSDEELPDIDPDGNPVKYSALQQDAIVPAGWKPTVAHPVPPMRCTGTVRSGVREGQRCGRWSIEGHDKCIVHGGNLPNVKEAARKHVEAARLRLIGGADDAIDTLFELMSSSQTADNIKLGAAKEILDRAGVKGPAEFHVEVEHKVSPVDAIRDKIAKIAKRQAEGPILLGETEGETIEGEVVEE